jgi:putative OPT family oligopeptide transporter
MDLLQHTYGFLGAPGADPSRALPAPQAGLISALAQGVITGDVPWDMIGLGAGIGVAIIILDEVLGLTKKGPRLPPLAVGLGIYLPTSTTLMVVVGALVGAWFDRRACRRPAEQADATRQLGVLLASGLIVGESLLAVIFAGVVAFSGEDAPIALVGKGFHIPAIWIGGVVFAVTVAVLYRWIMRMGRTAVDA